MLRTTKLLFKLIRIKLATVTQTLYMKEKLNKQNEKTKSEYDPFGSYTGNPIKGDVPEQDADDL